MTVEFHLLSVLVGIVLGAMIHPPWAMRRFLQGSRFPKKEGMSFKVVRIASRIVAERRQVSIATRIIAEHCELPTGGSALPGSPVSPELWERVAQEVNNERAVTFGKVRLGGRVVASLTPAGMWEGDPSQLAIWVKAGSIALSNVDPSVRPEVEQLVVGMMRKELRDDE